MVLTWNLGQAAVAGVLHVVYDKDPVSACENGNTRPVIAVEDLHLDHLCVLCFLKCQIFLKITSAFLCS